MSLLQPIFAAAVMLTLAGGAYAQEPVPRPGAVEAPAEDEGERPPIRPDSSPEAPADDDEAEAGDASGAEAEKDEKATDDERATEDTDETSEDAAKDQDGGVEEEESEAEPPRELPKETEQEYAACRLGLALLGTVYEERPKITEPDNAECGINRPLHVTEILPGLTLQGGAIMRCDTALALGFWAQQFLLPASANLPGAPRLTGLQLGTTYDCRARNGTGEKQPKLSEHALGNAIDIAAFEFDDGQTLVVEPRQDTGDLLEAFQQAARGSACLYFTTVLGPGSNAAHSDHLHLDVAARNNDWRLCQ